MGVFEKALQEQQPETVALTPAQAFAAIIVGTATADGTIGPEETARIDQVFGSTRLFQPPAEPLKAVLAEVMRLMQQYGEDTIVGLAAKVLPPPLHAPAFAAAVDLVLADGQAGVPERSFIDALRAQLEIDEPLALKIVEVMLIKNNV
jgi:uncharacterized membrane protein YebE (DUF533 family)